MWKNIREDSFLGNPEIVVGGFRHTRQLICTSHACECRLKDNPRPGSAKTIRNVPMKCQEELIRARICRILRGKHLDNARCVAQGGGFWWGEMRRKCGEPGWRASVP